MFHLGEITCFWVCQRWACSQNTGKVLSTGRQKDLRCCGRLPAPRSSQFAIVPYENSFPAGVCSMLQHPEAFSNVRSWRDFCRARCLGIQSPWEHDARACFAVRSRLVMNNEFCKGNAWTPPSTTTECSTNPRSHECKSSVPLFSQAGDTKHLAWSCTPLVQVGVD